MTAERILAPVLDAKLIIFWEFHIRIRIFEMYLPELQPQPLVTKQGVAGHKMGLALLVDSGCDGGIIRRGRIVQEFKLSLAANRSTVGIISNVVGIDSGKVADLDHQAIA